VLKTVVEYDRWPPKSFQVILVVLEFSTHPLVSHDSAHTRAHLGFHTLCAEDGSVVGDPLAVSSFFLASRMPSH
jgi:hypothetical protein